MKPKIIIGIDPDLHKSGVAFYQDGKFTGISAYPMWQLFDIIGHEGFNIFNDVTILLEYPDNTNTYHAGGKGAALNVGKNQAVAIIIKEFMDSCGIKYKLLKPKGYSNFFKDVNFFKLQTGWKERTNSDARAAAAMVWLNK